MDTVHSRITYESRSGVSERLIYPFGLYAHNGFWYCACFDYTRQQHVSLRADHFLTLEREEGHEKLPYMPVRAWLQISDPDVRKMLSMHVIISKHGMKEINWAIFDQQIEVDEQGCGTLRKAIPESELNFYTRLFLPLGTEVRIASPPELIEAIRRKVEEILKHYKSM